MTPKEKAKALVERFRMNVVDWEGCSINGHKAKQCALIAVDELINEYESNICYRGYDNDWEMWDMERDYWIEVKQEIENL